LLKIRLDSGSGVIDNGRPDGARDNAAGVLEPFFGSVIDYSVKPPTVGSLGIGRLFYTFRPTQDLAVSIGPDIQTNYEAFYNYPFSRNIQITPTIQVIDNAGNQGSNGTILTGTLRTVFSF
jgi:hypothetical protein